MRAAFAAEFLHFAVYDLIDHLFRLPGLQRLGAIQFALFLYDLCRYFFADQKKRAGRSDMYGYVFY